MALPHRFGDFAALTGRIIGAEGYSIAATSSTIRRCRSTRSVRACGSAGMCRDYSNALAEREAWPFAGPLGEVVPRRRRRRRPRSRSRSTSATPAVFTAWSFLDLRPRRANGFRGVACRSSIVCKAYDEATALRMVAREQATVHEAAPGV
jgi:hypothetical protein